MKDKIYSCEFAGHTVCYAFLNHKTYRHFGSRLVQSAETECDIKMSEERLRACRDSVGPMSEAYAEFKGLISLTSQFLLRYHCCIFHSAAFILNGKAWLISAPSGTGKTTQYLNLKKLYPEEITVISGDMPVLEMKDSRICVHPSPWNGKEGLAGAASAPLGGVVYLEQADHNQISCLTARDGIVPLLREFKTIIETKEEMETMAQMADCMFRNYPVLRFSNKGDLSSSRLLKNQLDKEFSI